MTMPMAFVPVGCHYVYQSTVSVAVPVACPPSLFLCLWLCRDDGCAWLCCGARCRGSTVSVTVFYIRRRIGMPSNRAEWRRRHKRLKRSSVGSSKRLDVCAFT